MTASKGQANLDFPRRLIEHCCWEDARVWRLVIAPLTDAQFEREVGFGLGSIRRECAQIMDIEWTILQRIRGNAAAAPGSGESELDRAGLRQQWRAIHAGWAGFLGELDEERFFSDCVIDAESRQHKLKVWQLICELIYQGTAHRANIMRLAAEVHEAPQFDLSLMQYLSGVFRQ